jgi:hypothetical protein
MAKGGCDFRQFKEFQEKLQKLEKADFEAFCEESAKELAARILAKVIKRTPTGTYALEEGKMGGTLKRGWTIGTMEKRGNLYQIEVINPTFYASYVEYGHRQQPGRFVPAIGKKLKQGWVKGRFMLTISENELKSEAPKILEKKLTRFLKEVID